MAPFAFCSRALPSSTAPIFGSAAAMLYVVPLAGLPPFQYTVGFGFWALVTGAGSSVKVSPLTVLTSPLEVPATTWRPTRAWVKDWPVSLSSVSV
jgi:hypothetical protein